MVERLTNLVSIFENPGLDFSQNRADNDDILGDAYEFLMRHFATESGKSKGQFYTPSEVSRIIAKVIGIAPDNVVASTTAYDPTCGSGSLLLKVAAEAGKQHITLEGQEKDVTTANPPFSDKTWSTGLTPATDTFQRFAWGEPPAKQGDYAYLLHIIRSMKTEGKGACILPHGVLFRGNAEAIIRKQLVRSGYLKGIIGLPANLFYGTGIPACILVLDKENAAARKGFSRLVPFDEIEKNEYNLNLPRYIDTREAEDVQDIDGHLNGGIPTRDIDALTEYWEVCPDLRATLFTDNRPGYHDLVVEADSLKATIHGHQQFGDFIEAANSHFALWRILAAANMRVLEQDCLPKHIIHELSGYLLGHYKGQPLLDAYAVYQHLMDYWAETMQDDCYLIAADGWLAKTHRVIETVKSGTNKGKTKDKGWACDLVPKPFIVARYFAKEQAEIDMLQSELETVAAAITELEEEHGCEDGAFAELDKINKGGVTKRLKEIKGDSSYRDDGKVLKQWRQLDKQRTGLRKKIKETEKRLDLLAYEKYPELTPVEVKRLVVDDKWLTTLDIAIHGEIDRISQALTGRVKDLAERYQVALPEMTERVAGLEEKVNGHLTRMGFKV